jgi:hypothetical protein
MSFIFHPCLGFSANWSILTKTQQDGIELEMFSHPNLMHSLNRRSFISSNSFSCLKSMFVGL